MLVTSYRADQKSTLVPTDAMNRPASYNST